MTNYQNILEKLPYSKPFLFVDQLLSISENGVVGTYQFKEDEYFYEGHFKEDPVTPGVILIECTVQIGLVCLGIFLSSEKETQDKPQIALVNSQVDFLLPVYPGDTVKVISEKEYFRFGKLKCKVKMLNDSDELVCKGIISGMAIL
ncbi:MAG: hydroxymyristoyl-ACP dehydratase [Bacteroidetes bacterium]|nr:MAG: hydroxymyristoyl-ACP dehydratase [Bacteroidota bacterium]